MTLLHLKKSENRLFSPLYLHSCFCTSLAQSGKHFAKVYLRVWFLMAGQNHSQDHL